jgi:putative ABC transport system permease protein
MIRNYLRTALRSLNKQRFYTYINILGLALGLGSCLLILAYVSYEYSYDSHYPNADNIYRVVCFWERGDDMESSANITHPAGPALKETMPEIEQQARIYQDRDVQIEFGQDQFVVETQFLMVDPEMLEVFSIPLINGNRATALSGPNSLIISQSIRESFFPNTDPIGQTVRIHDDIEMMITGVMSDMPDNTQLKTNFLASYATLETMGEDLTTWEGWWGTAYTYLLLSEDVDLASIEAKIPDLLTVHMGDEAEEYRLELQPLRSIYLNSDLSDELDPRGSMETIYIFSGIALLLLVIACMNYINLTTARMAHRAKEVGIRKVFGAGRWQLAHQFLAESILMVTMAMAAGLVFFELAIPALEQYAGRSLSIGLMDSPIVWVAGPCLILLVGLISGSYPAVILSRLRPQEIFKNSSFQSTGRFNLRRVLVAFQATCAITLMCLTFGINEQIEFAGSADLGFSHENILLYELPDKASNEKKVLFKNELSRLGLSNLTMAFGVPGENRTSLWSLHPESYDEDKKVMFSLYAGDNDYVKTLKLELVAGKSWDSEANSNEPNMLLINETAVKTMGIKEPIGFQLMSSNNSFTVIGVVKDFHAHPLNSEIQPTVILNRNGIGRVLALELPDENQAQMKTQIASVYEEVFSKTAPDAKYLDNLIAERYDDYRKLMYLFSVFSALGVFIACLGLLGLSAFAAERRIKEIGIRKVIGASVQQLVMLMTREFIILVALSSLVAWPISWYLLTGWLEDFPYHTELSVWLFLVPTLIALAVASVTVGSQAFKTARSNPVDALRAE